jgi:hypothetical protein
MLPVLQAARPELHTRITKSLLQITTHLPLQCCELLQPLSIRLACSIQLLAEHQPILSQLAPTQPVALTQRQQAGPHHALRSASHIAPQPAGLGSCHTLHLLQCCMSLCECIKHRKARIMKFPTPVAA